MRKHQSLLNTWVRSQAGTDKSIAQKIGINQGLLRLWLSKGYVPKKNIIKISKKTGILEINLMAEYNSVLGIINV